MRSATSIFRASMVLSRPKQPPNSAAVLILRIVGLPVRTEDEPEFLRAFDDAYPRIRGLPACDYLALIGSRSGAADYLTMSIWTSAKALEDYRKSPLFARIWPQIRKTLRDDPWVQSYDFAAGDGPWVGTLRDLT